MKEVHILYVHQHTIILINIVLTRSALFHMKIETVTTWTSKNVFLQALLKNKGHKTQDGDFQRKSTPRKKRNIHTGNENVCRIR